MRILVVDDEPSVRDALDRALRMDGYRVQLAADGREALDALARRPPDAIVLDVLPEPDGLEVCRRLRAAGDRTPVLMLTARDAVPDRVKGLDAGADDYLVKPFALEELGARLRALLRRSGGPVGERLRQEVEVSRPSDVLEARAAAKTTFTSLFLGLGAVTMLVGGVGIANVMVISVLERRSEIGLRRALGATRRHVGVQFLAESLLLAAAGGVAGTLLGALVTVG